MNPNAAVSAFIRIDGLSLAFGILGTVLFALGFVYSLGYVKRGRRWFFGVYVLFWLSSMASVFAANWYLFLAAWEFVSFCVFLLVYRSDAEAARSYFVLQLAGDGFLLAGVLILRLLTGDLTVGVVADPRVLPLFMVGMGMKAALPGLHSWLPELHSRAPAPVSALHSGFVVKLGVYGLIRVLGGPSPALLYLGLAGVFLGGVYALLQRDAKRILAFSTLSQLGYVFAALGLGTPAGTAAAVVHVVHHAVAKSTMFMSVGIIEKERGSRDLAELAGRGVGRGAAAWGMAVGAAAIVGLLPFAGYYSKAMLKLALKYSSGEVLALVRAANLLTVVYLSRLLYNLFRNPDGDRSDGRPLSGEMPETTHGTRSRERNWAPTHMRAAVLGGICAVLAAGSLVGPIAKLAAPGTGVLKLVKPDVLLETGITLALGAAVFFALRGLLEPRRAVLPHLDYLGWAVENVPDVLGKVLEAVHDDDLGRYLMWTVLALLGVAAFVFGIVGTI